MNDDPPRHNPIRIERPHLLLVEGQDEVRFFGALLGHMSIDSFQILDMEGKDKLPTFFPAVYRQLDRVRMPSYVMRRGVWKTRSRA